MAIAHPERELKIYLNTGLRIIAIVIVLTKAEQIYGLNSSTSV